MEAVPSIEWPQVLAKIEDLLFPQLKLDAWERSLYYHLLRHTRLVGTSAGVFAVGPLSKALGISDFKTRGVLRSLHAKECIVIDDRSRQGHHISVALPHEIGSLLRTAAPADPIDIESIDFFTGRKYLAHVLDREEGCCFYCLRELTAETCELDHLAPQVTALNNSYRNVVASCHGCNKGKGSTSAADYLRNRYRSSLLSEQELQGRLAALEAVQAGHVKPVLA
jgi:hypothetical protein